MPTIPEVEILKKTIKKPQAYDLDDLSSNIMVHNDHVLFCNDPEHSPRVIGGTNVFLKDLSLAKGININGFALKFVASGDSYEIEFLEELTPGTWTLYLASSQDKWGRTTGKLFVSDHGLTSGETLLTLDIQGAGSLCALKLATFSLDIKFLGKEDLDYIVSNLVKIDAAVALDVSVFTYRKIVPVNVGGYQVDATFLLLDLKRTLYRRPLGVDYTKAFEKVAVPVGSQEIYQVYIASNENNWDLIDPSFKGQMIFISESFDPRTPEAASLFPKDLGHGKTVDALYVGKVKLGFRNAVSEFDPNITGYLCDYGEIISAVVPNTLDWVPATQIGGYGQLNFRDLNNQYRLIGNTRVHVHGLTNLLPAFHYRPCLQYARYTKPIFTRSRIATGDYIFILTSPQRGWDEVFGLGHSQSILAIDSSYLLENEVRLDSIFPIKYKAGDDLQALILGKGFVSIINPGVSISSITWDDTFSHDTRVSVVNGDLVFEGTDVDIGNYTIDYCKSSLKKETKTYRNPIELIPSTRVGITNISVLNEIESGTFNVYIAGWTNWYAGMPDGNNYRGQLFLTNVLEDTTHTWFPHTDEFNKTRHALYLGKWKVDLERMFYPGYDKAAYVILSSELLDGHDPNLKLDADGNLYFEDKINTSRTIGGEGIAVSYLDLVEARDIFKPVIDFDFNYSRGVALTYTYKDSTVGSYNLGIATHDPDWQRIHPGLSGKLFLWSGHGYLEYMKPDRGRDSDYSRRDRLPLDLYSLGKYRIDFEDVTDPFTGITGFRMDRLKESKFLFSKSSYDRILELLSPQQNTGIVIDEFGNPWYDKFQDDTLDRTPEWEMEHGGLIENPQVLHVSVFHYKPHFLKPKNISETLIEEEYVQGTNYNIYVGSDQSLWNTKTNVGNLYRKSLFLSTLDIIPYTRLLHIDCSEITGVERYIEAEKLGECKINLTTKELSLGPQLKVEEKTGDVYYSDPVNTRLVVAGTEVDITRLSLFEESGRYRLPVVINGFTGLADLDQVISGEYNVFVTTNHGSWDAFCLGYRAQLILSALEPDPLTGLIDIPYKVNRLKAVCVGRVKFLWMERCIISPNYYQVIKVEPLEIYDPYTVITPDYEIIREMPSCALVHEQFPHPVLWTSRIGPGEFLPAISVIEREVPENYLTVESSFYRETFHGDETVNQRIRLLEGGDSPYVEPGLLVDFDSGASEFIDVVEEDKKGDGPGEVALTKDVYNKPVTKIRGVGIKNAALTMVGVSRYIDDYNLPVIQTTCPVYYTTVYSPDHNCLYSFGQDVVTQTVGELAVYDLLSGGVALGTPCPLPRQDHLACYWDKKIYYWGGRIRDFSRAGSIHTDRLFIYDIDNDSWTEGTPGGQSGRNNGGAAIAHDGKLYFFGGYWSDRADPNSSYWRNYELNSLDIYDIETDSWWAGLPLLGPTTGNLQGINFVVFNGLLYLYGGTFGSSYPYSYNKYLYAYDPILNSWSNVSTHSASRGKGGANVLFNNKLYCFGGSTSGTGPSSYEVETYDFATDEWSIKVMNEAVVPDYNLRASFAYQDKIYFPYAGGSSGLSIARFYPRHKEIFPATGVYSAKTTNLARLSAITWKGIDRIKVHATIPEQSVLAQIFSFDGGDTWKIFYNNVWLTVIRKFGTKWQYLDESNSFLDEPENDLFMCFKRSYTDGGRLWTKTSMEAMGPNEWNTSGGFPASAPGTSIDVAVLMQADECHYPSLSSYELILSSWETKSTGGTERSGHSAAFLTGRIFYWGGYTLISGQPVLLDSLDIYHIDTDTWEVGVPGGTPRTNHTAILYANWIYIWGGSDDTGVLNTLDIYRTGAARWDTGAQGGIPRELHSAVLYNNKFYFWGGRDGAGVPLDSLDIFNPLEGLWEIGISGGIPRYNHTATVIGSKMYIFGGVDQSGNIIPYVDIYDFETETWDVGAPASINRKGHVTVAYDNHLYVWGGLQQDPPLFVLRNETSIYDVSSTIWKDYGSAGGTRRTDAKSIFWQGKMYVWGGVTLSGDLHNTMEVCDIENMIKTIEYESELKVDYHDDKGLIRFWKRDEYFGGHFEGETKYMDNGGIAINRGGSPNVVALPCRDTGYPPKASVEIRKASNYSGTHTVVGPEIVLEPQSLDLTDGEYYAYLGTLDDVSEIGSDVVIKAIYKEENFTSGSVNRRVGIGPQGEEQSIIPYLKVELEERDNYIFSINGDGREDSSVALLSDMWGNRVNSIRGLEIENNHLGVISILKVIEPSWTQRSATLGNLYYHWCYTSLSSSIGSGWKGGSEPLILYNGKIYYLEDGLLVSVDTTMYECVEWDCRSYFENKAWGRRVTVVCVGDDFYFAGGMYAVPSVTFTEVLWRYKLNMVTRTWTRMSDLPTGAQISYAYYWDGKLYYFGWFPGSSSGLGIWDIEAESWSYAESSRNYYTQKTESISSSTTTYRFSAQDNFVYVAKYSQVNWEPKTEIQRFDLSTLSFDPDFATLLCPNYRSYNFGFLYCDNKLVLSGSAPETEYFDLITEIWTSIEHTYAGLTVTGCYHSGLKKMIWSSDGTSGFWEYQFAKDEYRTPSGLFVCYTGDQMQIDTANWTHITSVETVQDTPGASEIFFLVSFDNKQTFKAFISGQWEDIVKFDDGVWKYRDIYDVLVPGSQNTLFTTLKEALGVSVNRWNKDSLEGLTQENWDAEDGFVLGTLDFVFAFSGSSLNQIPTLSAVQIHHIGYSSGTEVITFTSQSDLIIEDLKGPIAWWRQDGGTDLTTGHFEGETKRLFGAAIERGSGRVSLPCDAFDLRAGYQISVRKTVNYNGQHKVMSPYTDIIGDFGEVIFFSQSPTLTALKLCKVKLSFTIETSLLEMPSYVYELYDQSSRYLKTTYNLGRISYYLETIDGQKWIPGVREALIFEEDALGNYLMVDHQPVLIDVKGEMKYVDTTTSTSTTTTVSTTTTTTTTLTTYDPLVLVTRWSTFITNSNENWPSSVGYNTTDIYKEGGIGFHSDSNQIVVLEGSTASYDSLYQVIFFSTPPDHLNQLYSSPYTRTFPLTSSYTKINMTAYDVDTRIAVAMYAVSGTFYMYTVNVQSDSALTLRTYGGVNDPYNLRNATRLCRAVGNHRVYFFTTSFSTVYMYNLDTFTWSSQATSGWSGPTTLYGVFPIYHPGLNAIFVCGGNTSYTNHYREIRKLDLSTYTWTTVGKMTSPASDLIFCAYENYLLGFGGTMYYQTYTYPYYSGNYSTSVLIFDVSSSQFRRIPGYKDNGYYSYLICAVQERNNRVTLVNGTPQLSPRYGTTTSSFLELL